MKGSSVLIVVLLERGENIPRTKRGYDFNEVLSALQKEIRRGKEYDALFWAVELEGFNPTALWNRLKIIASEDVGIAHSSMPLLIDILEKQYFKAVKDKDDSSRLFLANAIIALAKSPKSRMADDLVNVVYAEIQHENKKLPIPTTP